MTDLDITKLCAEAMGADFTLAMMREMGDKILPGYNPLHDDAQAMALVKNKTVEIARSKGGNWLVRDYRSGNFVEHADLNRAICECVAAMQVRARQNVSKYASAK